MQVARGGIGLLRIVLLAAVVAVPAMVLPQPADAQLSIADTRCRRALHSGAQRLFRTTLAKQASCHRQRMLGKFSALRDCTNPDTLPNSQILDVIENHLLRRARNSCSGAPARLGYEKCEAPCQNIPIVTFTDVARCLNCQAKAEARATTESLYGRPPVPGSNTDAVRCQSAIGSENIRYVTSLLTSHRRCQYLQDRGSIPATVDCRRDDLFFMFLRAREVLQRRIRNLCDLQQVNLLDGCTDQPDTLECILDEARASSDLLYTQVYQGEELSRGRIVFVTSDAYRASQLGSLAGADALCQAAAESSELRLDGTYRAWLSAGGESPATRFNRSTAPYILPNGTQVAASFAALVATNPEVAIDLDENGKPVIFERPVWTATGADGLPSPGAVDCEDWSSDFSLGTVGLPYFIGGGIWTNAGALRCGSEAHLYCFEQ